MISNCLPRRERIVVLQAFTQLEYKPGFAKEVFPKGDRRGSIDHGRHGFAYRTVRQREEVYSAYRAASTDSPKALRSRILTIYMHFSILPYPSLAGEALLPAYSPCGFSTKPASQYTPDHFPRHAEETQTAHAEAHRQKNQTKPINTVARPSKRTDASPSRRCRSTVPSNPPSRHQNGPMCLLWKRLKRLSTRAEDIAVAKHLTRNCCRSRRSRVASPRRLCLALGVPPFVSWSAA